MLATCLRSCQLARLFDPPGLEARLNVPPQCLDLDKFVAVPTEDRLVSRALELLANGTFWAGIVFDNLGSNASDVPPYVKYKIRMDIDEVEGTKKLKDRYVLLAAVPSGGVCLSAGRSQGVESCLTVVLACRLKITASPINKEMS